MSLSELVSSVAQPLLDLLPRISHRPASNEWGVYDCWFRGQGTFRGPYLHIPAITHIEYWAACEVPIDCGLQTLTTADGKNVAINVTAILKPSNPIELRKHCDLERWEEWAAMQIRGEVCDVVTGHNWEHLQDSSQELIETGVWSDFSEAGCWLQVLNVEDLTECFPLRTMSS